MNRALLERNVAAVLFVLVLVVFSFAERDTKKITRLYQNYKYSKPTVKLVNDQPILPIAQLPLRR